MANQNLIKGAYMGPQNAGIADLYLNSIAKKQGRMPGRYGGNIPVPYGAMQKFLNKKVDTYIDNLPPGYEVEKLPAYMRQGVTNWSKDMQLQAGNFARLMKKTKPGSAEYINANSMFNDVKNQFKNISSNLDQFKASKTEFLKDYDSKTISEGANTDQLKLLYSGQPSYSLINGQVKYQLEDGSMVDGNNLPKYFNKNSDGANKLMQLNESSYNSGTQWDDYQRSMYERKVRNIVQEKGREGLLSLATDNFLDEPIISKDQPESWLLQEENHDQLQQYVIDKYVNGMEEAANNGYQKKKSKTSTSGGGNAQGALTSVEYRDQYWGSGNLNMITNEPGWPTTHEVVDNGDGTFDVVYRSRDNAPIKVLGKNLDPTNPDHKRYWDNIIGGGNTTASSSSIDPNSI
jgi:hypothetical protein